MGRGGGRWVCGKVGRRVDWVGRRVGRWVGGRYIGGLVGR